jgi:asparagine synthase (glutamine-hydrolysing)
MCGIVGILNFFPKSYKINDSLTISEELIHRGPDGYNQYQDEYVILCHRRLSIIDLSSNGIQPFYNSDGKIVTVTNGEIYNFNSIRERLKCNGVSFKSTSDCEILAYLYEEKGIDFVKEIEGMFAIAIWDRNKSKLFLVRDRFGVKPLYYHSNKESFYFGSELKSILVNQEVDRYVDWQAIHNFFSLSYIPEPLTGFKDIYALEPGHYLEISDGKVKKVCYWNVDDIQNSSITYEEAIEKVNRLLEESVRRQLVADASLGAFLSGGIDSSTIVQKMRKILGKNDFDTFTVKFPDIDFDESAYAERISKIFNTRQFTFEIDAGKGDPLLIIKILNHFDQPFGDSSAIPTFLISEKIKKHIKVALSGDGGDEIFAGYLMFKYYKVIKKLSHFPNILKNLCYRILGIVKKIFPQKTRQLRKLLLLSSLKEYELICALQSYLSEENKRSLYSPLMLELLAANKVNSTSKLFKCFWSEKGDDALKISKLLFKTSLPSDMFKKVDMMSMLAGIEVRVPFLDESLVNFSLSLPEKFKLSNHKNKFILRDLLSSSLPDDIINKKKTGFAIPLDTLVNPKFIEMIYDHLIFKSEFITKICDSTVIRDWIDAFLGNKNLKSEISREGLYQRIFMLLSLEIWYRKYKPVF